MRYIDVTGKTEEEAVRKALEQLHLERDDVSLEILERSKSGFLGIGSSPAKVRVRYELDVVDEPEVKTPAPQAKPAEKKAAESKPVEKKPAEKKPAERKPVEKKPEPKPVEKKPEGKELTSAAACDNDDARRITEFLAGLLEHMCFNGTDHFKGNDLIKYCESIGVKFGRDLNAYERHVIHAALQDNGLGRIYAGNERRAMA